MFRLQYVVDTSGRTKFAAYHAFVDASRRSAVDTRYDPASVAGCAMSQYVEQPYEYHLAR